MSARFVCPELEGMKLHELIIKEFQVYKDSAVANYYTVTGFWALLTSRFTQQNKGRYGFGNVGLKPVMQRHARDLTSRTAVQYASTYGLTLTDNSGASATSFMWDVRSPGEIHSGFFYTIYTETGIILMNPYRTGNYQGVVTDGNIHSISASPLIVNYQGETGADYTIAADISRVKPAVINSALKTLAVNKEQSKQGVISFYSGADYACGDWVQYKTNSYVILSRRTLMNGDSFDGYIYTAVQESNSAFTFTGANVTPVYEATTKTGGSAPTSGDIASFDANGNLVDSGCVNPSQRTMLILSRINSHFSVTATGTMVVIPFNGIQTAVPTSNEWNGTNFIYTANRAKTVIVDCIIGSDNSTLTIYLKQCNSSGTVIDAEECGPGTAPSTSQSNYYPKVVAMFRMSAGDTLQALCRVNTVTTETIRYANGSVFRIAEI